MPLNYSQAKNLEKLAKLIRYFILLSSTKAGSGHPTSSLSATDLMTVLLFGGFFRFDLNHPDLPNNDRLIFSKGHASPLFYSMYAATGAIEQKELETMRKFGSRLEGHPTMLFPFTEAATGSLGQGLSIGVGMALNAKYVDKLPYKTFVLLGDSEMAEGSVWEAIQSAYHYKLDNLIAILDVNRLGQRGQTMYGHDVKAYQKRVSSFGWQTIVIDGHNLSQIDRAFKEALKIKDTPIMIIAKTKKGKGVSFIEDKDNWHGKALKQEEFEKAILELGEVDLKLRGRIASPSLRGATATKQSLTIIRDRHAEARDDEEKDSGLTELVEMTYNLGDLVATRRAYGNALLRIFPANPNMVVLDAEVSNSTYSEFFKKDHPDRFFEMYIAEQNMVGVSLGFSRRGKIPFTSTFAAFFTRAFDQIRMSQYSNPNIKFCGSHAGVSIGEDGASQMALEDLAMFRAVMNMVVLYPSDAVSTEKLVEQAAAHVGNVYIRTTRKDTPVIYKPTESFPIGGCKIHKSSPPSSQKAHSLSSRGARDEGSADSKITIIGAGVTLHEALKAQAELKEQGIETVVVDLYSIKPIDKKTLTKLAQETKAIITVEDHYPEGGLGEAVESALSDTPVKIYQLAVSKIPKSGKPEQLLEYEGIDAKSIIIKVKEIIKK